MSRRGSIAGIINPCSSNARPSFGAAPSRLRPTGVYHRCLAACSGEVDLCTAPAVRKELDLIEHGASVVIDHCEATFMDSTGLHALLATARNLDGHVYIACVPGGAIRRLFDVSLGTSTGSRKLFASRAEALAALRSLVPCGKQAAGVSGFRSRPSRLCRIALSW